MEKNSAMQTDSTYTGPERRTGKARYLSQTDVWAIAFGCIIGWGAFVMPGTTFLPIAGPGGTLAAMAISAVIMLVIGMNYAYLMVRKPRTGGVYAYTKEAFGRDHAFLCSWFLCLSYLSIVFLNATALFVVSRTVFGSLLQTGYHYRVAGYDVYLTEVCLSSAVLLVTGILFILKKPLLQRIQTALAVILLLGAVTITAVCLPHFRLEYLFNDSAFGVGDNHAVYVITTIVLLSPWAFVGFDVISLETVHFRFPIRKSGRIIALSILCGGFVYAAMSLVSVSSVPEGYGSWQAYIENLDDLSGIATVPTFFAAHSIMGTPGLILMSFTALAAILTGIIGAYRAATRILSTMAEDHILSERFSLTSFCIVFIMVISIAISFLGRNALEWFVELTTFGAIVGFGYTSFSAWRFATEEHDLRHRITGLTGTLITAAFAVVQLIPKVTLLETMGAQSFLMLALWCLLGFAFYWKTMRSSVLSDYQGVSTSSTVLFSLLLYSGLMWFILHLLEAADSPAFRQTIISNSILLAGLIFGGLLIMLYVQNHLREREEVLRREMIRAEESSLAKSRFLFNMSHDIRTPMNAIIGFTGLARRKGASIEEKDEYLAKIDSSGQQLLGIINDVLDMSRIESGKMELYPVHMNLPDVLSELEDVFRPQMEGKKIRFTLDASRIRDPWILCDRNRLNRVLLNLLSNAFKFTPEGGEVSVTALQKEDAEIKVLPASEKAPDHVRTGCYELRVKDSGIGMNADFLEHLFTPFERERTSTVSGIQGTGLGLSITKSIIDLMHGTIDVDTAPGRGTEFTIRLALPIVDGPENEKAEREISRLEPGSLHALLVDDNEINREIALMILSEAGITADEAENGRDAVDKLEHSEPGFYDLVLMDIQMPVMDGYEATAKIRALKDPVLSSIPVIAMTANAFREDEMAAEAAGMQGHISKPLDVDKMMKTLAEVMKEKKT